MHVHKLLLMYFLLSAHTVFTCLAIDKEKRFLHPNFCVINFHCPLLSNRGGEEKDVKRSEKRLVSSFSCFTFRSAHVGQAFDYCLLSFMEATQGFLDTICAPER